MERELEETLRDLAGEPAFAGELWHPRNCGKMAGACRSDDHIHPRVDMQYELTLGQRKGYSGFIDFCSDPANGLTHMVSTDEWSLGN